MNGFCGEGGSLLVLNGEKTNSATWGDRIDDDKENVFLVGLRQASSIISSRMQGRVECYLFLRPSILSCSLFILVFIYCSKGMHKVTLNYSKYTWQNEVSQAKKENDVNFLSMIVFQVH